MPDVADRKQLEDELEAAILLVFSQHSGTWPRLDWPAFQADLAQATNQVLRNVYAANRKKLLSDLAAGGTVGTEVVDDSDDRAETWAATYSDKLAAEVTARTKAQADAQLDGLSHDRSGEYLGQSRAVRLAITEVTKAATSGENDLLLALVGYNLRLKPIWITAEDDLVCPACRDLHNRGPKIWQEAAPDGPPLHPHCRCHLEYATKWLESWTDDVEEDWDESAHPRDDQGRFVDKADIEAAKTDLVEAGKILLTINRGDEIKKFKEATGLSWSKLDRARRAEYTAWRTAFNERHPHTLLVPIGSGFSRGVKKDRMALENLATIADTLDTLPGWKRTGGTGESIYWRHTSGATFRVANHHPAYIRSDTTGGVYPKFSDDPGRLGYPSGKELSDWLWKENDPKDVRSIATRLAADTVKAYKTPSQLEDDTAEAWTDEAREKSLEVRRAKAKLEKELARPTRIATSKAFRTWFGDSKVVDDNGRPMVVYHGTGQVFTKFDPKKLGSDSAYTELSKFGFFFTPDVDAAFDYATSTDSGNPEKVATPTVMPVYLRLAQPYGLTSVEWNEWANDPGSIDVDAIKEELQSKGYDGLHILGLDDEPDEYAVFDPGQVKHATKNSGRFDSDSDDITEATIPRPSIGAMASVDLIMR